MEPDAGRINGIGNIKQIYKRNKKNGSVMSSQVECAESTFNMLALLIKNCNVFLSRTPLL